MMVDPNLVTAALKNQRTREDVKWRYMLTRLQTS